MTPLAPVSAENREAIMRLQALLQEHEHKFPPIAQATRHYFSPGVYVRSLVIPAGWAIVGKIHRDAHLNILLQGTIAIATEHGHKIMQAPCILESQAGIKRAGLALTDTTWVSVHPNPDNCEDLDLLEDRYTVPDYSGIEHVKPDEFRQIGAP